MTKKEKRVYQMIKEALDKSDTGRAIIYGWRYGEKGRWVITTDALNDGEYMKRFGVKAAVPEYTVVKGGRTLVLHDPPLWSQYWC